MFHQAGHHVKINRLSRFPFWLPGSGQLRLKWRCFSPALTINIRAYTATRQEATPLVSNRPYVSHHDPFLSVDCGQLKGERKMRTLRKVLLAGSGLGVFLITAVLAQQSKRAKCLQDPPD